MAESFVFSIAGKVLDKLGSHALQELSLAWGVRNELRKLENTLSSVQAVCISEDFNLEKVIKKILKSANVADCNNLEIDQLQTRLREIVNDKKYFLVLDDVWNEDRNKWIELRNLLTGSATGSKIIVTTRNESVASVMAASTCKYKLEGLPYENCLSLFLKCAFSAREDADQHQNLVNIGGEIVKKCKGVPLAVRTLGNLLYMKTEERDWIYVRDNEIWKLEQKEDDILSALKLSYDQLPSHLKQCFAYCSIFGKDFEFSSIFLITCWRAQGLIQLSDQNQDLEALGKKYIEQLWSKGFFHELVDDGICLRFKLHDLVHDLSLLVAKPDCHVSKDSDIVQSSISAKVRHLSFPDGYSGSNEIPNRLLQLRHVRSVVFPVDGVGPTDESFIETCISRFKYLRTLDLGDSTVEVLPSSIGSLKHLRLLDLPRNRKIKSLPKSICNLVVLETLALLGCVKLEKLPKGLGKLFRLKTLAVTTKERCLPEKEIGCLTSLQFLMISDCPNIEFLLSNDVSRRLSALKTLIIESCESLVSLPTSGLGYLTKLENLGIAGCEKLDLMMDDDHFYHGEAAGAAEEARIQFPRGLSRLRCLGIYDMPQLVSLPLWVLHGANNLEHMRLGGCYNLMSLPEGIRRLTTLNEIHILECPELIRRIQRGTGEELKKISHVPNIYLDGRKIEKESLIRLDEMAQEMT